MLNKKHFPVRLTFKVNLNTKPTSHLFIGDNDDLWLLLDQDPETSTVTYGKVIQGVNDTYAKTYEA